MLGDAVAGLSKSCLGAGEWARLLPAELFLEKPEDKLILLFSD